MARIASLLSYPVEWCRGARVKSLGVGHAGADGDRRFRIVDEQGVTLSPGLLSRLFVEERGAELWLSAAGHQRLALHGGHEGAEAWLTSVLGRPARLVPRGEGVALPLLAATTASLSNLVDKLPAPVGMERFAPNVILEGTAPFEEDDWRALSVGGARFEVARPRAPKLDFGVELGFVAGQRPVQLRPGQTLTVER